MFCKDLKDGLLLSLVDDKFCVWFNSDTHAHLQSTWSDNIPKRIRVGSLAIGALSGEKVFTSQDTFIYVGKKLIVSRDSSKTRQLRLILVGGQLGFIEGYDVKFFDPIEKD